MKTALAILLLCSRCFGASILPPTPQVIVASTNEADTNCFYLVFGWNAVSNAAYYQFTSRSAYSTNIANITNSLFFTNSDCWETDQWYFAVATVASNGLESTNCSPLEYPFQFHVWTLQVSPTISGSWADTSYLITNFNQTLFQRWINSTNW